MVATNLMLGDWVKNTEFDKDEIDRIEIIEPTRVWLEGCKTYIPLCYIKPIPLTPEILEKNGIKRDTNGKVFGEYFDEDKNGFLEISVDCEGIWWSVNYEEYHILRFKYVHELQHALKLCGIKKEIEL